MYINLITIDLCPGQGGGGVKPSGSLYIPYNGDYNVYSYSKAVVDVHPSASLSETYISNGNYNITGEFNGGVITVDVPAPQFVTETLNVSENGTYNPGEGVDGYSKVVVDVPQSVTGFTEKEITEGIKIVNLSNSASYVHPFVFEKDTYLQIVNLPNCISVGENAFAVCNNLSSIYLPNVKTIESGAFDGCSRLTSLDLPNVERIEYDAFGNCTGLITISLLNAKKVGGFQRCTNLQEVVLPNVETIINSAFYNCLKISSIYFPNCISIESYAFNYCYSLSYVDLPKVKFISGDAFGYCSGLISVSMPNLIKISGYTAFQYCNSLSSLYLPKLRAIGGNWVFNDCSNLSIVDIPAVLTNGTDLLERDPNLKELYINSETYVIPSYMLSDTTTGITSIYTNINNVSRFMVASGWSSHLDKIIGVGDPSVFMLSYSDGVVNGMTKGIEYLYYSYLGMSINEARTNVVSVDLPNCDYIESQTFQYYSNLTNVSLPNCEYIASYAFTNTGLTSISLPNCNYISYSAFAYCNHLQNANIPNVEVIYSYTFNSCFSLTSVSLSKCKHIYNNAFNECINLSSLDLPICEKIDDYAFYLAGLRTITLGSNKVVSAADTALYALKNLSSIYVPASLLDAYKSARGFSQFSSIIFPIE